ncbi:MAG: hypothetical protein NTZ78_01595 [Candidatus Aureabacteria bacterium]|nr:hypothetical protein [Candidatus Auribacterota bacterium]
MGKAKDSSFVPAGRIEQRILLVRGQKVILDRDLAFCQHHFEMYLIPSV